MECMNLVVWRATYIRKIKQHCLYNRSPYYVEETWVNAGNHGLRFGWQGPF
ncbi:hypothetical protein IscW_ISCW000500 [Ixodes scapularis]|uniref:Uncharacterized protein n=1 Tax=Ixodes scapularis TaxID=6945 RepID=B7P254_IXOSC|nr:hypothetical protein IscW_ISCW000500 [Ixodes scapularis]|eukprot:XP_002401515.1 hypothetical protein IscW_ISCW000500 [Ixodes scapularis]